MRARKVLIVSHSKERENDKITVLLYGAQAREKALASEQAESERPRAV